MKQNFFFLNSIFLQNQQRELNIRHAKESERELEHRLQLQKDDYEATIQRHLTFIDQVRQRNESNRLKEKKKRFSFPADRR